MEPCCLCARPRVLVTSQPITELLRRLKKCEQERRRVEAKLQKKYKKIQQRELYKFEVERLRIRSIIFFKFPANLRFYHRCEEVLKPNYKKLTVQLFDDRDAKKKEMDRRAKGLESTGSHQRKTERMRKYVTGVKNQFKVVFGYSVLKLDKQISSSSGNKRRQASLLTCVLTKRRRCCQ